MVQKTDLRVIKTRKNLYESLIYLLKEKPFEEIKVSDICEHALINRSTFYAHYQDKYELFDSFIKDLKESFRLELKKNKNISNSKEYYIEMVKIFLNHVEEKKDIYFFIIINNKNSIIMDMIYETLNNDIKQSLDEDDNIKSNKIPSDIVTKFYLGAVFNVGMEWLRDNNSYTKQDIVNYLDKLIPDNI